MPRKKVFSVGEYYSRQTVLKEFGKKGQGKLGRSTVAVVGVGGLGTVASLYLALAGVGHLRLIDQDVVELANLHRQILYGPGDLGFPKVEVAAERLGRMNPSVRVEGVAENFNASNGEGLLSGVDCVVDGLDNMGSRYLVNRVCARLGIPYVFGAAIGVEGNVSVFEPPETPCLECLLPGVDDASLETCDVRGVLGVTAGIVGSLEAMEAVKVLAGLGSSLRGRLLVCDFSDMFFSTIDIFKRPGCMVCAGGSGVSVGVGKVAWLCGRDTVNVNPERPWEVGLDEVYSVVEREFKVRLRSRFAVVFGYKRFEVTLFGGGRMLIKNVKSEKEALDVYNVVCERLFGKR